MKIKQTELVKVETFYEGNSFSLFDRSVLKSVPISSWRWSTPKAASVTLTTTWTSARKVWPTAWWVWRLKPGASVGSTDFHFGWSVFQSIPDILSQGLCPATLIPSTPCESTTPRNFIYIELDNRDWAKRLTKASKHNKGKYQPGINYRYQMPSWTTES